MTIYQILMTKYQRLFTNDYQISTNSYVRIYTQIMQNKAKVKYAKINVNSYMKSIYAKMDIWLLGKTNPIKAKTKPIQTQLLQRAKMMQSVYIQRIKKKNANMGYEKTNPIQSQFKANQSQS